MPFGIENFGAALVRRMKKLLPGLDHVESYIDVLIVYTKGWDTYKLQVLDKLFRRLQQVYLALRPTKCMFGSKFVEFLGHVVGSNCITINEENLEKICQAKPSHHEERSTIVCGTC